MPSPEWLIESGIGETRAALVEDGEIVEARIELEGAVAAGSVISARLTNTGTKGRNAVAVDETGSEYLLPRGAPGATEGAALVIEVTRETIAGGEPWKRALAVITDKMLAAAPPLKDRIAGREVVFPGPNDELGQAGWDDLINQAGAGHVAFASGELRISPTPAMTLIDVDGYLDAAELAVVGAREAAKAIRRLDISGSIGIDLPTTGNKDVRQAAAQAIDAVLPQPFQRTAVNGFGFVQIIRPRRRASLVELAQDAASFEARALLRRVPMQGSGPRTLVAAPAVIRLLERRRDWIEALARQIGGAVSLRPDPNLPMSGGYAEPL